jgi:hypothetical protein
MSYNPITAVSSSADGVSLGRASSSSRYGRHVVQNLSHVAGRRMGIIACQPPHPTAGGGTDLWKVGTKLTGSNYICHGTRMSGTYDEVAIDASLPFFGPSRDQGATSIGIMTLPRITNTEQNRQFHQASTSPMTVTASFSDDGSTNPILSTKYEDDLTQIYYGRPAISFTSQYYAACQYNEVYNDCGSWQLTTKDLHSVQYYTNRSALYPSFNLLNIAQGLGPEERDRATLAISASYQPITSSDSANWQRTDAYFDRALVYQSDFNREGQ